MEYDIDHRSDIMHILFAEDEIALSEALVDILTFHNYSVDTVYYGTEALEKIQNNRYDAVILDIMMPRMDGMEVLTRMRAAGDTTPVLLLTAKSDLESRVKGLDAGADDYLPKPFAMDELLARLRALLRRRESFTPETLSFGNIELNQMRFTVSVGTESTPLSKLEYQLLELFVRNPGTLFSAETLLERIWGDDCDAKVGTVWVYIFYLRKKLTALGANVAIRSKRSVGYSLELEK